MGVEPFHVAAAGGTPVRLPVDGREPGLGGYTLCQIPLTAEAWAEVDLKPEAAAKLVRTAVSHDGLFALRDLRVQNGH